MVELLALAGFGLAMIFGISSVLDDDDVIGGQDTSDQGERIDGTDGNDDLMGDGLNDLLFGGTGDDFLSGGNGNDRAFGGEGNDVLTGGNGDDLLRGSDGTDVLFGRAGNDDLRGDLQDDWLDGGKGDDVLNGGFGDDLVAGGTGADTLEGGGGDDVVIGAKGLDFALSDDALADLRDDFSEGFDAFNPDDPNPDNGGPRTDDGEVDILDGGDGDDLLIAGAGDTSTGGNGEDVFVLINDVGGDLSVITDFDDDEDSLLYLYDETQGEPVMDLTVNADGTQTLTADGEDLATILSADLSLDSVVLMPRNLAA